MAYMESIDFCYDGKYSSDFGIFNVSMDNGLFSEQFIAPRNIIETKVRGNPKPYFHGVEYEPLSLSLSFAFERKWDDKLIRDVAKWLGQEQYKPLWFAENPDRIYYAMVAEDSQIIHNGVKEGYLTITMRCDSPYTYSPVVLTTEYDFSTNDVNGRSITFTNNGDVICSPEIWITKVGNGGDVSIVNTTNGNREFKFTSPKSSSDLSFSGDVKDTERVTIGANVFEFDDNGSVTAGRTAVYLGVKNPTSAPTISVVADSGSTLPAGSYYVRYTWSNEYGETLPSPNILATVAANQKIVVTLPTKPIEATYGSIYIGATNAEKFQGTYFPTSFTIMTPLLIGTNAYPSVNTTINYSYNNAIKLLTYAVNTVSTVVRATQNGSTMSIVANDSNPITISESCLNASFGAATTLSAGLQNGEVIYVNNEIESIESSLVNTYRYDLFNNKYLQMRVGVNQLKVYGNVKIVLRYQCKTTQG